MSLLTVQETAGQFTEKLVEVTVIKRTSSGSPSTTANNGIRRSGGHSSRQRHCQVLSSQESPEDCRDDTGAVQRQMPNVKKISKT